MAKRKKAIPWGESEEYQRLALTTVDARFRYFQTLGEPDEDVWFPVVDPFFFGGPEWPTRPAWQPIRNGDQTLVASSGLSDPFSDAEGPNIGFGVETVVVTDEHLGRDLRGSWTFQLAQAISNWAARDALFQRCRENHGLFLFGGPLAGDEYRQWTYKDGYVYFMLGMPIPGASLAIELPAGAATLLTAKLVRPAEVEFVAQDESNGAALLWELFQQDGTVHISSLQRPSVI